MLNEAKERAVPRAGDSSRPFLTAPPPLPPGLSIPRETTSRLVGHYHGNWPAGALAASRATTVFRVIPQAARCKGPPLSLPYLARGGLDNTSWLLALASMGNMAASSPMRPRYGIVYLRCPKKRKQDHMEETMCFGSSVTTCAFCGRDSRWASVTGLRCVHGLARLTTQRNATPMKGEMRRRRRP